MRVFTFIWVISHTTELNAIKDISLSTSILNLDCSSLGFVLKCLLSFKYSLECQRLELLFHIKKFLMKRDVSDTFARFIKKLRKEQSSLLICPLYPVIGLTISYIILENTQTNVVHVGEIFEGFQPSRKVTFLYVMEHIKFNVISNVKQKARSNLCYVISD